MLAGVDVVPVLRSRDRVEQQLLFRAANRAVELRAVLIQNQAVAIANEVWGAVSG